MTELEAWDLAHPRPYWCRCGHGLDSHRPNRDSGTDCMWCPCDFYSEIKPTKEPS